jgi:hypothetical protein
MPAMVSTGSPVRIRPSALPHRAAASPSLVPQVRQHDHVAFVRDCLSLSDDRRRPNPIKEPKMALRLDIRHLQRPRMVRRGSGVRVPRRLSGAGCLRWGGSWGEPAPPSSRLGSGVRVPRRLSVLDQPMPVSRSPAEESPRARARTTIVSRRGERLQRSSRLISVRCRSQMSASSSWERLNRSRWLRRFSANCCRTDSCGFTRRTLASGRRKVYRQAVARQKTD